MFGVCVYRIQSPRDYCSHIALVHVKTGEKTTILQELNDSRQEDLTPVHNADLEANAEVFVNMQNINVRFHERLGDVSQPSFHTQFTINCSVSEKDHSLGRSLASPRRKR
jgi:hypothetical protein